MNREHISLYFVIIMTGIISLHFDAFATLRGLGASFLAMTLFIKILPSLQGTSDVATEFTNSAEPIPKLTCMTPISLLQNKSYNVSNRTYNKK